MAKISRVRGNNAEYAVAKILGAKKNHFEKEDLHHAILSIEVKSREKLPVLIKKFMAQAVAACPDDKLPCVVMHELNAKHTDDFVLLRLGDFEDIVGILLKAKNEE